jgi:hypothetical protein
MRTAPVEPVPGRRSASGAAAAHPRAAPGFRGPAVTAAQGVVGRGDRRHAAHIVVGRDVHGRGAGTVGQEPKGRRSRDRPWIDAAGNAAVFMKWQAGGARHGAIHAAHQAFGFLHRPCKQDGFVEQPRGVAGDAGMPVPSRNRWCSRLASTSGNPSRSWPMRQGREAMYSMNRRSRPLLCDGGARKLPGATPARAASRSSASS